MLKRRLGHVRDAVLEEELNHGEEQAIGSYSQGVGDRWNEIRGGSNHPLFELISADCWASDSFSKSARQGGFARTTWPAHDHQGRTPTQSLTHNARMTDQALAGLLA